MLDQLSKVYTLDMLRSEARELVYRRMLTRQDTIAALRRYLPKREWQQIEALLEQHELLTREPIETLLCKEDWSED